MKRYKSKRHRKHHQHTMTIDEWHAFKELEKMKWIRFFSTLDLMIGLFRILPRYLGMEPADDPYPNEY